ncbi:MAG: tetratricopeptide repeat protein [Terracidiphilus sp.]
MLRLSILAVMSAAALAVPGATAFLTAQNAPLARIPPISAPSTSPSSGATDALSELRTGSDLTRQGYPQQAIPHLLAAQSAGQDPYAVGINLGICYLATEQYPKAISVLQALDTSGLRTAAVDNLLSQAYIANGQADEAFRAFLLAAAFNPKDEKLYAFLADACTDHKDYDLGLRIVNRGLTQLPASARLHYEKAMFLARLGSFEEARPEFDRAAQLAPGGYIGYLAQVQKALYEGNLPAADKILHQAIQAGHRDYRMLSLLGTVLLHEGVMPGQDRFSEAKAALEESARDQPDYPATQIALGRIFLMQGDARNAVTHLEIGRRLEPEDPSVYANLADAYETLGDRAKARAMRRQIGRLLAEKQTKSAGPAPKQHR